VFFRETGRSKAGALLALNVQTFKKNKENEGERTHHGYTFFLQAAFIA